MNFLVDFSIERGFRLFNQQKKNNHKSSYYNFFVIQITCNKEIIKNGLYQFELIDKNSNIVFTRSIYVVIDKKIVITPNSHEDPLIEDEKNYMLCFQLWDNDIKTIQKTLKNNKYSENFISEKVSVSLKNPSKEYIVKNHKLNNLSEIFDYNFKKNSYLTEDYSIKTDKDCIFRVHLGYENGSYEEKEYFLKAGESFNFYEYLINPYVGLQCSYEEKNPEIEEKHIAIGQKSMTLSGVYRENNIDYVSLLPFDNKYQVLFSPDDIKESSFAFIKKEKWTLINSLKDLLEYYKDKKIIFFESSLDFLELQYREHLTYGLNKTFSSLDKNNKKLHIDLEVCKNCNNNAKCVQIVPSGLSPALFKKNLLLEDKYQCKFFNLIEIKNNNS